MKKTIFVIVALCCFVALLSGCEQQPQPVAVNAVYLNTTSYDMTEGETFTLEATVSPENADNKKIIWSSSNASVATVSNGVVTALKEGQAIITATSDDNGKKAECKITVHSKTINVTSISLNTETLTLDEGASETLVATIEPENASNKNVSWSSSNESVATVDENGKVTGIEAGTTTIIVTTEDGGKTATCEVTVIARVSGITLDKTSLTLEEGARETLTATITPSNASNQYLIWESSDTYVATVDAFGQVTAIMAGTATITVTTKDGGMTAACEVTVIARTEGVSLNKTSLTLNEGESETLTATIKPENASNKNVSWKSSDTSIATVDTNGKVTAVKAGTATITVTTEDGGKTATCEVTVTKAAVLVTGVSLNSTYLDLTVGDSATLVETVTPSDADNKSVTWTSSNAGVASVTNGVVSAVSEGSAIITVMTVDGGKTATCTVKVTAKVVEQYVDLGLSVLWATCNLGASKPEGYGLYYQWGDIQGYGSDTGDGKYFYWIDNNGNITYKWCKGSSSSLTKYNADPSYGIVDNKTILDLEDDAAHVLLGGKWRIPIEEEWTELRENCIWTWTTENGINGYRITSKKSGYTDKYIFLPAAGIRTYSDLRNVGSNGYYWTSSIGLSPYSSFEVIFASGGKDWGSYSRCTGHTIRPVYGDAVQEIHVSSVSVNRTSLSLDEGQSEILTATVTPSNATNKNVSWKSSDASVANVDASGIITAVKAGSATITATTVDGRMTASCIVTVTSPSSGSAEYVDLGLSVKWATCNLGASRPEEYGGYYQWAGTEDVTSTSIDLRWDNVPYHTGSDGDAGWTKYIPSNKGSYWSGSGNPDNKTVLDPDDDAAHVALGGKWRMPTDDEWAELMNDCTLTWTTVNGVNGYRLTSKKSGYTNKSIFIPAAGHRRNSSLISVGTTCYYWSSSLFVDNPESALNAYFTPYLRTAEENSRSCGLSIRPVYGDAVQEVHVSSVSLNKTTLSLEEGQSETLTATVSPSNATNKGVSWKSSNSSVATVDSKGKVTAVKAGTSTITVTTVDGSKTATCAVTVTSPSSGSVDYVDLGLSVKWATCNLGASMPEEYGLYFQWGDTQGYGSDTSDGKYFLWNHNGNVTYKWCNGSYDTLTKYNTKSSYGSVVDNKTVLDPEDDAAHTALGGKWRMPTGAEWTELRNNCTWTWTTVNGINGYRVTSKKSGYTDKSIFLPAAGYRRFDNLYNVGSLGYYWSSSLNTDYPYSAYYVNFDSSNVSRYYSSRYYGRSIRPVSE